uniref:WD_REPEATS_REGION domain-containing protein n=1 Tax=Heterorhabditis bacteriophora TaxID=37862 RepID=A0A1I7XFI8_HETBA
MSKIEQICLHSICGEEIEGSRVWMISWNHSGTLLASCGEDKTVRIWKKIDEKPFLECRSTIDDSHSRTIRCVNFSHCGKYLASASFDASIVIYTHEKLRYSLPHSLTRFYILRVERSGDEETIIFCGSSDVHEGEVNCVAWNPSDCDLLASCSDDGSIRLFQVDL